MTSRTVHDRPHVEVRLASELDSVAMTRVEAAARALLVAEGVDLGALEVPEGFEEPSSWTWALVADVGGEVVGMARLTELSRELVCLDQVSVHPGFAGQGLGRLLLTEAATRARVLGYSAITGTTFRDVAFNAPFYERLGWVEDTDPHVDMVRRRGVEQELGLDRFGPRLVMRLPL